MPLAKLKNSQSVKLALDSVLQIRKLVFQLQQLHPKNYPKPSVKLSQIGCKFGAVSETCGLASQIHKWLETSPLHFKEINM